jgi:hypothetical protein
VSWTERSEIMLTKAMAITVALPQFLGVGSLAQAERFDQVVGATSPGGDAYLVKRFPGLRGSTITGVAFYTNDLRTSFPWVGLLVGPASRLSETTVLAELGNVHARDQHRTVVGCTPIRSELDAEVLVAIRLPASSGVRGVGDGAGVAARKVQSPAYSYFADGWSGVFGEMDVEYGIELLFAEAGKSMPAEPQSAPLEVFLHATSPVALSSVLEFSVDRRSVVRLAIYDAIGRHVRTVVHGTLKPGVYTYPWDVRGESGTTVAAGIYFAKLAVGERVLTKKLLVAK